VGNPADRAADAQIQSNICEQAICVNYYKRHIGDYAAKTRHLSLLEHGVYTILMDVYYSSEKALPLELRDVQRLVGARSEDERQAVQVVLEEFFQKAADGWHQGRCDEEIAHKQEKGAVNSSLGKLGGRPKQITDSVIPERETLSDQSETVSAKLPGRLANETQANSHKPIANSQYSQEGTDVPSAADKSALPDCPHVALIDLFGQLLPELPQPKPEMWDGKSAEYLRARWRWVLTAKRRNGARYATNRDEAIDWFRRFFTYVSGSDFLMGRRGDFTCSLQWLVKAANFQKVVQGNYENREAA
jgi:uncharacterized protein YdaU (DUF1376 family)